MKTYTYILYLFIFLNSVLYATSGTLSVGPVNGLAHTGVGAYKEIDTMILNPAWIGDFSATHVDRTLTLGFINYIPNYESKLNLVSSTTQVENKLGTIQLPYVGYVARLSPHLTYGFGIFSGGGSGSDFSDSPTAYDAYYVNTDSFYGSTSFVNSIAYAYKNYRFGISFDILSGILSSSYDDVSATIGSSGTPVKLDAFSATSSTRYLMGVGYLINDNTQFGINYTSKLKMNYEDGAVTYTDNNYVYSTKTIEEPARLSLGSSYKYKNVDVLTDVHYFFWEDTNQVKNGWVNNSMYNIALVFDTIPEKLKTAIGYSYSTRVIKNTTAESVAVLLMNTAFQPAIQEIEWSCSIDYIVNDKLNLSVNAVYWPQTTLTQSFGTIVGDLSTSGYGVSLRFKLAI